MSAAAVMAIQARGLHVQLGGRAVLQGLDLAIASGQWTCVVGPNGAGKSTLLKCISRMLGSTGRLALEGVSLHDYAAHQVVGRGICHCPEGRRLFPELTVLKNLMLGAYLRDDADAGRPSA